MMSGLHLVAVDCLLYTFLRRLADFYVYHNRKGVSEPFACS